MLAVGFCGTSVFAQNAPSAESPTKQTQVVSKKSMKLKHKLVHVDEAAAVESAPAQPVKTSKVAAQKHVVTNRALVKEAAKQKATPNNK